MEAITNLYDEKGVVLKINKYLFLFSIVVSFLFFSVQLAVGKIMTPIFGGTAWVWVLTLLFFQSSLLLGYLLAGLLTNQNPRHYLYFLGVLMVVSALVVPSPEQWGASLSSYELRDVLIVLISAMSLPAIALSSATIILQRTAYNLDITPWQLYFFSNVGSISAVILYPLVIENAFTISTFILLWRILILGLGLIIIAVTTRIFEFNQTKPSIEQDNNREDGFKVFKWIFYSCIPSAALAITSAALTQDIAPVPFLWALPLAAFLIAFALPFAPKPIHANWIVIVINAILLSVLVLSSIKFIELNATFLAIIYITLLFVVTWVCVTELIVNKPPARKLQYFYICIAIGGVIGTALVSIIAPLIFNDYFERVFIAIIIYWIPYFIYATKENRSIKYITYSLVSAIIIITLIITFTQMNALLTADGQSNTDNNIHQSRSMYGVITVIEQVDTNGTGERRLVHGNTLHGSQLITMNELDNTKPTTYFGYNSPLSILFNIIRKHEDAQVAIIGLGAGVMNYYSSDLTEITYFEIDNNMAQVALEHFSFLNKNQDNYKIEIGDGRRLIATKQNETYSMVIMDAFSSGSVPTHLLTTEAINIYFEKLTDEGILLLHTPNRYIDIHVIADIVLRSNGYHSYIYRAEDSEEGLPSIWVIGSKLELDEIANLPQVEIITDTSLYDKTWTDNFTPLLPFLKKNN